MKKANTLTSLDAQALTNLGLSGASSSRAAASAAGGFTGALRNTLKMSENMLGFLVDLNAAYADDSLRPLRCNTAAFKACLAVHPEHIKRLYADHHQFKFEKSFARPLQVSLGFSLVTVDQENWAPMRRRTARYFRHEALQQYGDTVVDVVQDVTMPVLREKARRGLEIDVFNEMLDIASIIAFRSFLGKEGESVPGEVYRTLNEVFC